MHFNAHQSGCLLTVVSWIFATGFDVIFAVRCVVDIVQPSSASLEYLTCKLYLPFDRSQGLSQANLGIL